jgi:hypothetical protein
MWEHGYVSYSPYCVTYSQRLRVLVKSSYGMLRSVDSISYYPRIPAVNDLAPSSQSVFDFVRKKTRCNLALALVIEERCGEGLSRFHQVFGFD